MKRKIIAAIFTGMLTAALFPAIAHAEIENPEDYMGIWYANYVIYSDESSERHNVAEYLNQYLEMRLMEDGSAYMEMSYNSEESDSAEILKVSWKLEGGKILVSLEEGDIYLDTVDGEFAADSPKSIYRKGQTRYIAVKADIKDGYVVSDVSREVEKIVNQTKKPAGYEMELDGENEATTEAMGQVLLMMVLGVLLMYLIMVAQFQSLLSPFIILFTIPLAFTGGFLGLWISGSDVSVIAMIGFVMLSGIIVNNGIVLVDYINQLRRSGVEKRQAIEEAGVTRLRPILMTALTTVLGLIPMVAGSSMGADMTRPMAIVTIGGLVYGTLLTLFVVPCIYDLLNRKKDMREKTVDEESMIEEAMDEKE